jgi:L-aspartate oxidase
MALAAGAAVADLEFMQFHPTALHHPVMPRPLLSEALRGEGALLRDEQGVAFMAAEHPLADLAPRDVVSRAIARRLVDRGLDNLWLDATSIEDFPHRFPTIWAHCRDAGLDPTREWLPVAPAAHYLCGGVVTDVDGASSLPGLWACGEVACTGIHGANRLASNSLLEGLVFGYRLATAIAAGRDGAEPTGAIRSIPLDDLPTWRSSATPLVALERQVVADLREWLQRDMTTFAGVLRDGSGLEQAAAALEAVDAAVADTEHAADGAGPDLRGGAELRNLLTVGRAVVTAATERRESRGCHRRLDFPEPRQPLERIVHFGPARRVRVPAAVAVSERER